MEFAFEIFDADRSGNLDQDELRRFFAMFRRPLLAKVDQAMGRFYRTCGYREELREQIATAATSTFDDYVDSIVPEIFAQVSSRAWSSRLLDAGLARSHVRASERFPLDPYSGMVAVGAEVCRSY